MQRRVFNAVLIKFNCKQLRGKNHLRRAVLLLNNRRYIVLQICPYLTPDSGVFTLNVTDG